MLRIDSEMKAHHDKWAILIGVNRYHASLGPLKYAVNDCRRVGEVLMQGPDGFPADNVLLLTDDQPEDRRPTYANIHSWLASWLSQPKEGDTVFVFFSGHGREMGGKCYLAPGDATLPSMHVTGIPVGHVQDILARCKAKQKILVLDACHSGAGKDVTAMSGSMLDQIATGKGIYTITSCDADELSHEWDEKKQGVFSYYLAEALSGACPPDSQGRVTAESLYEWVYDRVRAWAAKKRCTQTPKRFAEGTGVVTVLNVEPDWRKMAQELRHRLEHAEEQLLDMRANSPTLQSVSNGSPTKEHFVPTMVTEGRKNLFGRRPKGFEADVDAIARIIANHTSRGRISIIGVADAPKVDHPLRAAFMKRGFLCVELKEAEVYFDVEDVELVGMITMQVRLTAVKSRTAEQIWAGKLRITSRDFW